MLHKTKGIVLKTVKYGETSLIATVYTEMFGTQSYIINGVRNSKKSSHKANLYQPASILNLVVYHNENKGLQRISDASWSVIYLNILDDVIKNCIALFMVELLNKSLKNGEPNEQVFDFLEQSFMQLDHAQNNVVANYIPYFALRLGSYLGFQILNNYTSENIYFDIKEGCFVPDNKNIAIVSEPYSGYLSLFMNVNNLQELENIQLNKIKRIEILNIIENFYQLHIAEFGTMQTLKILPLIFNS